MKYIIANWKAHKNLQEAKKWVRDFRQNDLSILSEDVQLIICPPYPHIYMLKEAFADVKGVHIGSQNVSAHSEGTYTGEVPAEVLDGLISYTIVGHSERRNLLNKETDDDVTKKAMQASMHGITPIVCVQGPNQTVPEVECLVAYEPIGSISTGDGHGSTADMDDILTTRATYIQQQIRGFLYGGSVNQDNIKTIFHHSEIDGVLVGGMSLEANDLYQLIKKATE